MFLVFTTSIKKNHEKEGVITKLDVNAIGIIQKLADINHREHI